MTIPAIHKVRISGWKKGATTVSAIKALQEATSLGLVDSKRHIEAVLDGKVVDVTPSAGASSEELVAKLRDNGFLSSVVEV